MPEIPPKNEYRVGEVCEYTDTQPYVLRFWESEFPQLTPYKNESGHRVYSREDLELVLRIKRLLYEEECTIDGARKRLEEEAEAWGAAAHEDEPEPSGRRRGSPEASVRTTSKGRAHVESAPLFRSTAETVERERYDNAVREIHRLRAEIQGLQEDLEEQRARVRELERSARERRERTAAAVRRLEGLLDRIGAGHGRSGAET